MENINCEDGAVFTLYGYATEDEILEVIGMDDEEILERKKRLTYDINDDPIRSKILNGIIKL